MRGLNDICTIRDGEDTFDNSRYADKGSLNFQNGNSYRDDISASSSDPDEFAAVGSPIPLKQSSRAGHRHSVVTFPSDGGSKVIISSTGLQGDYTRTVDQSFSLSGTRGGIPPLRYRTDLDKQVIHFMFERWQDEQILQGRVAENQRDSVLQEVKLNEPKGGDLSRNIKVGDWHIFWMHVGRVRHTTCSTTFRFNSGQIINHFPTHYELTRKDLMYKNIKKYLRMEDAHGRRNITLLLGLNWVGAAELTSLRSELFPVSCFTATKTGLTTHHSNTSAARQQMQTYLLQLREKSLIETYCIADGIPVTYNIPNEKAILLEELRRGRGEQWIAKPTSSSQGKGISLINSILSLEQLIEGINEVKRMPYSVFAPGREGKATTTQNPKTAGTVLPGSYIVSRYIANPLLIGGKKFDLRMYVLVTSFRPLVAYLHEDGFARFCATRYQKKSIGAKNLGGHLTNVSLQKGDDHYNTAHGGKWSFRNFFLYVQSRYSAYRAEGMVKKIEFLIYHSLLAVQPEMMNSAHSFELYGYDILIDDKINPHLIEVNSSPSLTATTVADRFLKEQVLTDMLKIILPPGFPNSNTKTYAEHRLCMEHASEVVTGFKRLQF